MLSSLQEIPKAISLRKTTRKSAPFRAKPCLYPTHYRSAFAFSEIAYPHLLRPPLRSACLFRGGDTGLPCSTCLVRWVRPQLSPGSPSCPCAPNVERSSRLLTFWSRLISIFSLSDFNEVYRWFTSVGHATKPSTAPALMLAGQAALRSAVLDPSGSGYIVTTAPHPAIAGGARVDRLLRTEPQVWSGSCDLATQPNKRLSRRTHI